MKPAVHQSGATVSVRSVRPLLVRLAIAGIDAQALLREAGIHHPLAHFDDVETRIAHEVAVDLWRRASRATGDADLGLHVAETLQPGAFDVLDYAVRSSATLGDSWQCMLRYHRFFHDAALLQLEIEQDLVHLSHVLPANVPAIHRPIADFVIAGWLLTSRQSSGIDFPVREACFRHPKPKDVAEYRRIFRGPVHFGTSHNRFTVPRALLETPLIKSDPGLTAVLSRHVDEVMARLPADHSLTSRVRALLGSELGGGGPSAAAIARKLRMSTRTLHRRLAEENSSYQAILEALRKDLAVRHLAEPRVALAEVAFLLGFSEPSAFHRAFKRWTGTTPAEYRRTLL